MSGILQTTVNFVKEHPISVSATVVCLSVGLVLAIKFFSSKDHIKRPPSELLSRLDPDAKCAQWLVVLSNEPSFTSAYLMALRPGKLRTMIVHPAGTKPRAAGEDYDVDMALDDLPRLTEFFQHRHIKLLVNLMPVSEGTFASESVVQLLGFASENMCRYQLGCIVTVSPEENKAGKKFSAYATQLVDEAAKKGLYRQDVRVPAGGIVENGAMMELVQMSIAGLGKQQMVALDSGN